MLWTLFLQNSFMTLLLRWMSDIHLELLRHSKGIQANLLCFYGLSNNIRLPAGKKIKFIKASEVGIKKPIKKLMLLPKNIVNSIWYNGTTNGCCHQDNRFFIENLLLTKPIVIISFLHSFLLRPRTLHTSFVWSYTLVYYVINEKWTQFIYFKSGRFSLFGRRFKIGSRCNSECIKYQNETWIGS